MRKGLGHASPVEIAGEDCSNLDIGSQSHTRHTKPTEPDQREPAQAHIDAATQGSSRCMHLMLLMQTVDSRSCQEACDVTSLFYLFRPKPHYRNIDSHVNLC